jgi:hypothetical protein
MRKRCGVFLGRGGGREEDVCGKEARVRVGVEQSRRGEGRRGGGGMVRALSLLLCSSFDASPLF